MLLLWWCAQGNMFVNAGEGAVFRLDAATQAMGTAFIGDGTGPVPQIGKCLADAVACTRVPKGFGPFSRSKCGDFAFSDRGNNIKMYKGATKSFDNVYNVTRTWVWPNLGLAKLMWDVNGYDVWVGDTNRCVLTTHELCGRRQQSHGIARPQTQQGLCDTGHVYMLHKYFNGWFLQLERIGQGNPYTSTSLCANLILTSALDGLQHCATLHTCCMTE
jgi:hypothetical protein